MKFRLLHVLHHSLLTGYEESPHGHQEEWRGDRDTVRPEPHRQPQEQHGLADGRHRAEPGRQSPGERFRKKILLTFKFKIFVFQLYMYTFSGLQDKKANHLTQFVGFLVTHL